MSCKVRWKATIPKLCDGAVYGIVYSVNLFNQLPVKTKTFFIKFTEH